MDGEATLAGILLLLLITSAGPVSADDGPKGLSIDCGSDRSYTDQATNITWLTDDGNVATGANFQNISVADVSNINTEQSASLRYFDNGRGRNCYVLNATTRDVPYIVRATFYYGDWNSTENVTSFGVYLNANYWLTFDFNQTTANYVTYWFEALVYITSPTLDVCLVKRIGTPFISSLELRELDSGMYLAVIGSSKYMTLTARVNSGAKLDSTYLRYPTDQYDRIWVAPGAWAVNVTSTSSGGVTSNSLKEKPPLAVMQDAWTHPLYLEFNYTYYGVTAVGQVATYSYFQDFTGDSSTTYVRAIQYYINDLLIDTFNLTSDQAYEVNSCILDINDRYVSINVTKAPGSDLGPILNAYEIYVVGDWNGSLTTSGEVKAIRKIQKQVNLDDWTGDPCVPLPYDWLGCELYPPNDQGTLVANQTIIAVTGVLPAVVTMVNLSNSGLTSIPSLGLSAFDHLTVLDLSNNSFSGDVYSFVQSINVSSLQKLIAPKNNLEGAFPLSQLYDLAEFRNLKEANFDENPNINGVLNLTSWLAAIKPMNPGSSPPSPLSPSPSPSPSTSPTTQSSMVFPRIYLRKNHITGIYPSLEELTSDISTFLLSFQTKADSFSNYGILLGGNPWCQEKDFSAQPLSQQYLCRSDPDQILPGLASLSSSKKSENLGPIIGGVVGAFAFLVCCCVAALWWLRSRLKKETSALREIHDALAKQKVKPPFYSYVDIQTATKNFSPANELGHGAFGRVYQGTLSDSRDGKVEQVAVKQLYPSKQGLSEFLNEVVLITGIKHRNLVQLKGCCLPKDGQRMLVYEFAEKGNLAEALWDKGAKEETSTPLEWQQRVNICVGIARGLSYLHEELQPRIIHRDIKPANILLDKNLNAKIADFGTARYLSEEIEDEDSFTKNITGTKGYFSPEYATRGQLTEKADVYSFGVVLLEIVSGRKCIDSQLPGEQQFLHEWARNLKESGNLLDLIDPRVRKTANNEEVMRVINLAFLCLDFYPERRPRMSEAVSMLQGLMDVTLYKPESHVSSFNFGRSSDHQSYARLAMDQISEEYATESLVITTSSSTDNYINAELELTKLSGR